MRGLENPDSEPRPPTRTGSNRRTFFGGVDHAQARCYASSARTRTEDAGENRKDWGEREGGERWEEWKRWVWGMGMGLGTGIGVPPPERDRGGPNVFTPFASVPESGFDGGYPADDS